MFAPDPGPRAADGVRSDGAVVAGRSPRPALARRTRSTSPRPPNEPLAQPGRGVPGRATRRRSCAPSRPQHALMVSGDGEGLVDVADVGLLDGAGVMRYSRVVPDAGRAARRGRARRRARRDRREPRAGRGAGARCTTTSATPSRRGRSRSSPTRATRGSPLFPGEPADALTTTQQRGVKTIQATAYGNTITYTPEDRAARALDGDPTTAWRAARASATRVGQCIRLELDGADHDRSREPRAAAQRRAATAGSRRSQLTFDGGTRCTSRSTPSSRTAAGQTISFPSRDASRTLDDPHHQT